MVGYFICSKKQKDLLWRKFIGVNRRIELTLTIFNSLVFNIRLLKLLNREHISSARVKRIKDQSHILY